jgi:hypothetical protein
MVLKYLNRNHMNLLERTLETKRENQKGGWRKVECSSEKCLLNDYRWGMAGKKPPAGLIRGTKKNQFLAGAHTVVTGENTDKKIHRLMDNLYDVYRKDRHAEAGTNQMPWIGTLRAHQSSEFHIYATEEGVVKGFFVSLLHRDEAGQSCVTMAFVWVVPRFRGQGLFTQMCDDLLERRGTFFVEQPNEACQMALLSLGCSEETAWEYSKPSRARR